ncbi:MAG TPA: hypothetical protein VG123_33270, partial [Streptosporangiaceae bacterium]|nr:hypothetical protein [Streptosporangiaceae bacterium]
MLALGVVAGLALAACSSSSPAAAPHHVATTAPGPAHPAPSPATPPAAPTPAAGQPGWTVVSRLGLGIAVDSHRSHLPDGDVVTVLRFHAGLVHYALHVGWVDPPGGAAAPPGARPVIGPGQHARLLAAFNGGFLMGAGCIPCGVGGMKVAGHLFVPLVRGMTSLVLNRDGAASMGVWGHGFPAAGAAVYSVRQCLPPLVAGGRASPTVGDVGAWGAVLGGGELTARSAVGIDARGDLLYAGSMSALPSDMARALVRAGAVTAMQFDINPEWVQADTAPFPGGPLSAAVPGQNRPADQYLTGWTR